MTKAGNMIKIEIIIGTIRISEVEIEVNITEVME